MSIYEDLLKDRPFLKEAEDVAGLDAFLVSEKRKVASMGDLSDFFRISSETLVHKAQKDLWRISENNGQVVIERLFDPNTKEPIKV